MWCVNCLCRISELEEKMRDKNIKIIELEALKDRLEKENKMIEEKLNSSLPNFNNPTTKRPSTAMVQCIIIMWTTDANGSNYRDATEGFITTHYWT